MLTSVVTKYMSICPACWICSQSIVRCWPMGIYSGQEVASKLVHVADGVITVSCGAFNNVVILLPLCGSRPLGHRKRCAGVHKQSSQTNKHIHTLNNRCATAKKSRTRTALQTSPSSRCNPVGADREVNPLDAWRIHVNSVPLHSPGRPNPDTTLSILREYCGIIGPEGIRTLGTGSIPLLEVLCRLARRHQEANGVTGPFPMVVGYVCGHFDAVRQLVSVHAACRAA